MARGPRRVPLINAAGNSDAAGLPGGVTQNGYALDASTVSGGSLAYQVTGTANLTATIGIQVSNDPQPDGAPPMNDGGGPTVGNWVDLPNPTISKKVSLTGDASGMIALDFGGASYRWVRIAFIVTAGNGGTVAAQLLMTERA